MAMASRLRTSSEASEHEDEPVKGVCVSRTGVHPRQGGPVTSSKPFFHKKFFRRFSTGGGIGVRTIQAVPEPKREQKDAFVPKTSKKAIKPERRRFSTSTSSSNPTCYVRISPQNYLDSLLRSRSYSTQRFKTLQTAYYNEPTPLQLASYNVYLIDLLRQDDRETFRAVMNSGISPNPCNAANGSDSSLVHTICRRGNHAFLRIMLNELRVPVQVSDANGLTPLHEACRNCNGVPSFEAVQLLLDQDPRLLYFEDSRGLTPLEYIRQADWPAWMVFLRRNRDRYWPVQHGGKAYGTSTVTMTNHRRQSLSGVLTSSSSHHQQTPQRPNPPRRQSLSGVTSHQKTKQRPPYLAILGPNSRPLADPSPCLPLRIAARVAAGQMQPEDAVRYRCGQGIKEKGESDVCGDTDTDDEEDTFHKDDDDHDDEEYHHHIGGEGRGGGLIDPDSIGGRYGGASTRSVASNITWDEEETAAVLRNLTVAPAKATPIAWCDPSAKKRRMKRHRNNHLLHRRQFNEPQNLYFR